MLEIKLTAGGNVLQIAFIPPSTHNKRSKTQRDANKQS